MTEQTGATNYYFDELYADFGPNGAFSLPPFTQAQADARYPQAGSYVAATAGGTQLAAPLGGVFYDNGGFSVNVKHPAYGAKGTALRVSDGAMTASSNVLTTSGSGFAIGQTVFVSGAGGVQSAGPACAMLASVTAVGSGTVTLSVAATTTVTGAQVDYGTNDLAAIQAALTALSAAGGGELFIPDGTYLVAIDSTLSPGPNTVTPGSYHALNYAISVPSNTKITMAGGATIRFPFNGAGSDPRAACFCLLANTTNVTFQAPTIDGCGLTGGNLESEHYGILAVDGLVGLKILDGQFHHLYGKGLLCIGSGGLQRITLRGSRAYNNFGQHATIANATWVKVINTDTDDNLSGGAEAFLFDRGVTNLLFQGNHENNQGTLFSIPTGGTNVKVLDNIGTDDIAVNGTLVDVTIARNTCSAIAQTSGSCTNLKVLDNTVSGNVGINPPTASVGITVSGNDIGGSLTVHPTNVTTSVRVIRNTASAVTLVNLTRPIIGHNSFEGTTGTTSAGLVSLTTCTYPSLVANDIFTTGATAINFNACTHGSVTGGIIESDGTAGGGTVCYGGVSGTLSTNFTFLGVVITDSTWSHGKDIVSGFDATTTFQNCDLSVIAGDHSAMVGASIIKGCQGYNPFGVIVVAVPATTVAVAAVSYDRTFYVTAGASTCTMAIGGGPSPVVPSGGFATVRVPAGQTVTPTFTAAPTWVVEGE